MAKPITKSTVALGTALLAITGAGVAQAATNTTPAASSPAPAPPVPGKGPADGGPAAHEAALAKALGVSADKLRDAEASIRSGESKPDPQADQARDAKALASALGVDESKIEAVLEAQRPAPPAGGPTPPTGTTPPKPSGTTPPKPSGTTPPKPSGTTPPKPSGTTPPQGPAGGPPKPPAGGPAADRDSLVSALAKATGKSESEVKAALGKLDDAREADRKDRDAAHAKKLAAALGLDESKVSAALEASRPKPPTK